MRFSVKTFFEPGAILLFCLAFTLAYFVFAHEGFFFNDDYTNAEMAANLLQGNFHPQAIPAYHRPMIYGPAAVFLYLFGTNIYTLTLWPLICTLASLIVIYFLLRKQDKTLTNFALILTGLNFHTLFLSVYFFPDNIVQFFALATAGCLFIARRSERNHVLWGIIFVLFNFCAFLSKETIVFYLPFFIWVALSDYFHDKHTIFWNTALVAGLLVLGFYFLYYKLIFGSFFYRFQMVENTHILMAKNEAYKDIDLFKRLITAPLPFLIETGIFFPVAFCFYYFRKNSLKQLFIPDFSQNFWMFLALSALFFFWFGSTSLVSYRPITLVPRMAALLLPPLCIAAAYQLRNFFLSKRGALWFAIPLLLAALYARSAMSIVYGLPALYFLIYSFTTEKKRKFLNTPAFLLLLGFVLILRPIHFMRKPTISSFFEQEKIVTELIKNSKGKIYLFADGWFEKSQAYYFGFKLHPDIEIRNYEDVKNFKPIKNSTAYMLINASTLSNPDLQFKKPQPGFTINQQKIDQLFPAKEVISKSGKVQLFKLSLNANVK